MLESDTPPSEPKASLLTSSAARLFKMLRREFYSMLLNVERRAPRASVTQLILNVLPCSEIFCFIVQSNSCGKGILNVLNGYSNTIKVLILK